MTAVDNDGTALTTTECPLTQTLQAYDTVAKTWVNYECADTDTFLDANNYSCADYTANNGASPYLCDGTNNGSNGFDAGAQCCLCGGGDVSRTDQIKPADGSGDPIASCTYGAVTGGGAPACVY